MSFASHHYHGLIDACVSDALREILHVRSVIYAPQTADDIIQVARGIESAVQAAIVRFYTAWNDAHRDPVLRLPRELMLECFEALDFKGRQAVTHVSRAWRRVALSDRRLWNSLSLSHTRSEVALDLLAAFLHRSDPKPFALSSMDQDGRVSGAVLPVIIKHLDRIESLKIAWLPHYCLLDLFAQPAPILRTFVYASVLDLSWLWAGTIVPCLENIKVQHFCVTAAFRAITTLRMFTAHLRLHDGPPEALFKIFPGVTSLKFYDVAEQSLKDLGWQWLAPSVTSLNLHASRQLGLDYSPIIPMLTRLNLSSLFLGSASTISDIVQLFVEKTRGERRIDIPRRGDVYMESGGGDIRFTINTSYASLSLDKEPGILAPLRAFSSLSLTLELLVAIRGSLTEGDPTLLNLRSLNIMLDWMDEFEYLPAIYERTGGPIDAPQLQSLSFTVLFVGYHAPEDHLKELGSWLGTDLPAALPLVLSYPRPTVQSITIQAEDTALLIRCGADNMRRLAAGLSVSELNILNLKTREVTELPLQDNRDACG